MDDASRCDSMEDAERCGAPGLGLVVSGGVALDAFPESQQTERMVNLDEIPEPLRLNYLVGEITISDSYAEHEARVLWNALGNVGLVKGKWPETFGRLLPGLEDAFGRPEVPDELREIVLPLLSQTRRWHKYRRDLVHDLLTTGWGQEGHVQSALGKNPPRPMADLAECGEALRSCGWRLRGVWIVAPWWLGGEVDSWETAEQLRSWTRVAMGHLADIPNAIIGTEGPAPEPPGGWVALVVAEVAKREVEDARLSCLVSWLGPDEDS